MTRDSEVWAGDGLVNTDPYGVLNTKGTTINLKLDVDFCIKLPKRRLSPNKWSEVYTE